MNRWNKAKCHLPKIKCSSCPNRKLKHLDEKAIYNHLVGKIIIGVYPILHNDNCNFLAIDFDKKCWKKDISALYSTCTKLEIPVSIEISRSGNGGHIWIFFSEEISALKARRLGTYIISETMKTGNLLDLKSYDRMFPNQDYLPEGGFGNLIALPLQKKARINVCSVFVDDNFDAFPDQWAYLSFLNKINTNDIDRIINTKSIAIPTITLNIPHKVRIIILNQIYVCKDGLPKFLYYKFIHLAAFPNPAFYIAQASRRSTHNIPRFIKCSLNLPKMFSIPTGLLDKVTEILLENKVKFTIEDNRIIGSRIQCDFIGNLSSKQEIALAEVLKYDMSVLCASTGFGKTILAIKVMSVRKVNTLILVHRIELLNQWKEKINIFSKNVEVGTIGASNLQQTLQIDIAMIQTLKNYSMKQIDHYGQIIIDECHHIAAYTFEKILKKTRAKYILGLTATPKRKDGHHPIVFMQCGEIKYKSFSKPNFDTMNVFPKAVEIIIEEKNCSLPRLLSHLAENNERNELIYKDIVSVLKRKRKPLLLTERVKHLKYLGKLLKSSCKNVIILNGKLKKKEKERISNQLKSLNSSDEFVIIATGKYIGEGFDLPILDTLLLALPISWKGTLQQYIGRVVREHKDKSSIEVYDYVDVNFEKLEKMFIKRKKAYKRLEFNINLEK
ncbi:MAG: DEAD/DEAH box helicase [Candidatus Cloacimonetes bacterium]|nr:DEAD/DEAH box helicase [Candidatus Cloacimonadota bacterium]